MHAGDAIQSGSGGRPRALAYHIAHTSSWKAIQTTLDLRDGDDVQILRARVVGAVHHGRHRQTQRDAELAPTRTTPSALRHRAFGMRSTGKPAVSSKG